MEEKFRWSSLFKKEAVAFLLMFVISILLNVDYAILRSARTALAVADLGGGASSIPWFELLGTMPSAVLMTLGLTFLLNRLSLHKVFFIVLSIFLLFFLSFSFGIYPLLPKAGHLIWISKMATMSFFVMAELWKIALLTVLFWGLVNQYVPLEEAKRFYAPLMLGSSLGTMLAGPIISFCTSDFFSKGSWSHSLNAMVVMVTFLALITAYLFHLLWKRFSLKDPISIEKKKKEPSSVWKSFSICFQSKYLMLLAWITIADYIAYALGEVIFLDLLKQKFPTPRAYADFMGNLSVWNGFLTAFSAVIITPLLLQKARWVTSSIITPLCLVVIEGLFFFTLWHPLFQSDLNIQVILGSCFYCFVRAAKYTLFDTSKEISFLLLPPLEKLHGKLIVDGICSRLGRGSSSFISILLIQLSGSVMASVFLAGSLAMVIATTCLFATIRLGKLVDDRYRKQKAIES